MNMIKKEKHKVREIDVKRVFILTYLLLYSGLYIKNICCHPNSSLRCQPHLLPPAGLPRILR